MLSRCPPLSATPVYSQALDCLSGIGGPYAPIDSDELRSLLEALSDGVGDAVTFPSFRPSQIRQLFISLGELASDSADPERAALVAEAQAAVLASLSAEGAGET